jgi:hypothetical protein
LQGHLSGAALKEELSDGGQVMFSGLQEKVAPMFNNFQNMQKFFADPFASPFEGLTKPTREAAVKLGAITAEATDYTKKSFEKGQAHFEKLAGVKSPEEAFQLQTSFAKSAYDDCIGRIEKITEMYSDLVKAAVPQADNSFVFRRAILTP